MPSAEIHRVLKPGGSLIVNVAAIEALRGNHSVLSGEMRRYSKAGLRSRLEAAGFRVTHATYTNFTILPMVAAVRMKQRLSGDHVESQEEITVPPAPVNLLLSGLLAAEAAAARFVNMPIGSSLLTVASVGPAEPDTTCDCPRLRVRLQAAGYSTLTPKRRSARCRWSPAPLSPPGTKKRELAMVTRPSAASSSAAGRAIS